ncbi:DMT family transporter [Gallibacterium anatis]|uniref:DMT family transporter n=1 Tax=Gallibacterium anatis TaxID=750 RepID=UPI00254AAEAB|nr:multidrug efflux SMR transporter [Gallibacterium anatis]WIM81951.1 multidrug efflux SMR transporter [Gallibacterium anatis]
MYWLFLGIAIVAEVFASSMLKVSEGFSRLYPSIGVVIGYVLSFYLLGLALKGIPLSAAYAIWSGIGIILTAAISVFFFGQKVDVGGLIGISFILIGVIVLSLFSQMARH